MREVMDTISREKTKKPGWDTNHVTKPLMVGVGQSFIRNAEIKIYDGPTVGELKAYSQLGVNKYGAARGHDDRVTSLLQALAVIEPRIANIQRKARREKEKAHERKLIKEGKIIKDEEPYDAILGSEF